MFGFNKKKPLMEGPIEFEAEVEIDCSAQRVYELIDVSSPKHAQIELGNTIEPVAGSDNTYRLELAQMEGTQFLMTVLAAVPGESHTVSAQIEPRVGNLESAIEDYAIETRGDNACTVRLTTKASFVDGLSDEEIADEVMMMSMAVQNDLTKLKLHAEEGPAAVEAFDEEMFGEIEFDCSGIDLDDIDLDDIDWDEIEPNG